MKATDRTGGPLGAWLVFGICAALAFWTAAGVSPWAGDAHNAWHHYEYMTEGFFQGHTYLSVEPDPRLLAAQDPYDPSQSRAYGLWDASLYRGRYYLYYGPAPALALMLPWRILTGREMPQNLAVAAYAVLGLAALVLLLGGIRARHFPGVSSLALAGIVAVAFHASWLPVVLRRAAFWEMPIVSAAAFLWWALYFLWRFHDSGKARWAVGGGVALALVVGCRVTFVFSAAAIAALYLVPRGGAGARCARGWAVALAPAGLLFVGGLALLAFNYARFGRWLEFGRSYQLWGVDYRGLQLFGLGFVPFNIQVYLLSLPQFGPYFPFLHPFSSADPPPGYQGSEEPYGVLFMAPILLAGVCALTWAWRHRARPEARAASVTAAAGACAGLCTAAVLFCYGASCSRYIVELVAGWTVVSAIGLLAFVDGGRAGRKALAGAAGLWTVACVWLASAEFRGFMVRTHPRTYSALAHLLDYPSQWWIRAHPMRFGPIEMAVRIPPQPPGTRRNLLASGRPDRVNLLTLDYLSGGRVDLELVENEHLVLQTPPFPPPPGSLAVRLDAPWLYPPSDHPYWDGVDPKAARERQTLFRLEAGGTVVSTHSIHAADPVAFAPAVAAAAQAAPGAPAVESLQAAAPLP